MGSDISSTLVALKNTNLLAYTNSSGLVKNEVGRVIEMSQNPGRSDQPANLANAETRSLLEKSSAAQFGSPLEVSVPQINAALNSLNPSLGLDPNVISPQVAAVLLGTPIGEAAKYVPAHPWQGDLNGGALNYQNYANKTFADLNAGRALGFDVTAPVATTGYDPPVQTDPVVLNTPTAPTDMGQYEPSAAQIDAVMGNADFTKAPDFSSWLSMLSNTIKSPVAYAETAQNAPIIQTRVGEAPGTSQAATPTQVPRPPASEDVSVMVNFGTANGYWNWFNYDNVPVSSIMSDPQGSARELVARYLAASNALSASQSLASGRSASGIAA